MTSGVRATPVGVVARGGGRTPGPHSGQGLLRNRLLLRTLRGVHPLRYYAWVPEPLRPDGPVVAVIHGVSRNAREQALAFAARAQRDGVTLLAPAFARDTCRDFQRLGWTGRGWRTDFLLDAIVAELTADAGLGPAPLSLFGFSGGAQFAHRYALANPGRVHALVLCAAGFYTMPDPARPFPCGLDCSGLQPPLRNRFDLEGFLGIPTLTVVGDRDTRRDRNLRRKPDLDATQGRNRVRRARRWVAELRRECGERGLPVRCEYAEVASAGHDFNACVTHGLVDLVWPWLTGSAASRVRDHP